MILELLLEAAIEVALHLQAVGLELLRIMHLEAVEQLLLL